jgi:DNA processing protein
MAVPGKIDSPLAKGPHQLLKQGARLVETVEDVLETLGYLGEQLKDCATEAQTQAKKKHEPPIPIEQTLSLSRQEKQILNALDTEPVHLDDIITASKLTSGSAQSALICLQLKGLVKNLPGNFFKRR